MDELRFHPDAVSELDQSITWYMNHSPAVAQRFVVAIEDTISKITAASDRFPKIASEHQTCGVSGFPFQIVF